jgi:CheY-like chemotaxis protein
VVLIGPLFSERARDLVARLAHLGARIRAMPEPDADAAAEADSVVILTPDPGEATGHVETLRAACGKRVILHLCGDAANAAPGTRPLVLPETDAALLGLFTHDGQDTPKEPAKSQERTRVRIVAAEDNKTNQLVFRTMLKSQDADLTLVDSGLALVAAYKEDPPDIVLTDISMPGMDGLEATVLIRAYEAEVGLPRVPIIAMTAHAVSGDRARFLESGMDDVLTKPLKKEALLARIEAYTPRAE